MYTYKMSLNLSPPISSPTQKTHTLNSLPTCSNFIFHAFPSKPISIFTNLSLKTYAISSSPNGSVVNSVESVKPEVEVQSDNKLIILNEKLMKLGIDGSHCIPGQYYGMSCPKCKGGDAGEQTLSLFITKDCDAALWTCFRAECGWKGSTQTLPNKSSNGKMYTITKPKEIRQLTDQRLDLQPLCSEIRAYFSERMISEETLKRNFVMQKTYGDQIAIAFTYRRNGKLISCKYRDVNKKFWQESNTEKIFYGVDDIKGASEIIIVEGEMDKLALEEAGFRNCVSVPDGAPPSVSKNSLPSKEEDLKYQYLWNCREYLEKASRIILATDGDQPGQALAEELARRLGRERCWKVKWPKKDENGHFKDANEVLMFMGPEVLRGAIENAEVYPIKGLFSFADFFDEINAYYYQTLSYQLGVSTGWRGLDQYYNVVPGELTIVTGVPNSGKSEWIDALLCNLCENVGWKFALCSMENKVREHARKLLEKHVKKPFFDASILTTLY